ncbi:zinc finger protein MEP-1 [Musca autumnalis]|uniref:zinc finger protein MEP-1 n=1 Tax=Musca autumnalis TaxID=221902 RepID=UPI003CF29160
MTEVGVSMPEGSGLSSTANLQKSETTATASGSQENGSPTNINDSGSSKTTQSTIKLNQNCNKDETMEVDGVDTEEDDSQITSSTETGGGTGGDVRDRDENSNNSKTEIPSKTSGNVNEDSSNACESISQNCDSVNSSDAGKTHSSNRARDSDNDTNTNDSHAASKTQHSEEGEGPISADGSANHVDDTSNDNSNHTNPDPLAVPNSKQSQNGSASAEEKQSDGGVVDLGDDSDIEMSETSNRKDSQNKDKPQTHDSDGAVVIGSDSENESEKPSNVSVAPTPPPSKSSETASKPPAVVEDDDDDDDCVVIEDDSPPPTANDLSKRKLDATGGQEDLSQPPNKRQRNSLTPTQGQLSIKDARSLMGPSSDVSNKNAIVYPVNITPASPVTGPPKLVPVGAPIAATSSIPGLAMLPGLNNTTNANCLPGLTDDMFVLEAPSFIVPYIYEKPPSDQIKDVVKELEEKFAFTKEDLATVDKTDEFDMMTEQNKEDREEKSAKKKKRGQGDDDSWSEEDEDSEEDDDDDSESGVRTKVLIKEASDDISALKGAIKPAAAVAATATNSTVPAKPGQENYFESPLGKFFMDIGVGLVQEYVQNDLIRLQKRKMRKSLGRNTAEFEKAIAALTANMEASKKKNAPFKFNMKRCEFCNFKSESALAMANHYETPHMNGVMYKCNFCIFEIRNATEIVYHMEAVHNIKARLIKPLPYHQCPNCGFEDNGKAKLARHQPVCAKKFRPEINLAPPNDWEAPAKIPRIKPRHGLVGTATAYQAMAAQAAAQKAALATIQQQQQARNLQAAALAAQTAAANKIRGRSPQMPVGNKNIPPSTGAMIRAANQVRNPAATNVVLPNNYQLGNIAGQILSGNAASSKKQLSTGQPSISITPLPRQTAGAAAQSPTTSKVPPAGMKPGQNPAGGKAQFVICEICDGYIKDLEQLRNHMQWMHKVKIHPKMIYNRPPLNCQKCQFRFFTDQGLERHLLGSHGLVTSSMQEAANKGKDAGRCPVCGRMYQWKLLNHVSRDHHMTLKPAHLSYKCTVCTATFGMYKQFETHVYTAHSTVAKKAMDGKKNSTATNSSAGSSGRNSLSAANDSLLKPLKINDEITIIPQPASKSRISNMDTHVID